MIVDCTNWDAAKAELFHNHTVKLVGGKHDGVTVMAPMISIWLGSTPKITGVVNDKYATFDLTDSIGFIGKDDNEYRWPGRTDYGTKRRAKLTIIQGGALGKVQVWERRKVSTKSSKSTRA